MIKISVKEIAQIAAILGLFMATLLLLPEAARAQSVHEGKFGAGANGRASVYTNATSATQAVLVTVCVTTTGPQSAAIESRDSAGTLVEALANVKFGQCRSVSNELAVDNVITVRGITAVSVSGTYTLSILP